MRGLVLAIFAAIVFGTTPAAHAEDPEDLTPPVIQVTPMPGGAGGWYADTATVFVKATDPGPIASGVRIVSWAMTGATNSAGTVHRTDGGTLTVSNGGLTTIDIEATDANDNTSYAQTQIGIDRMKPTAVFSGRLAEVAPTFPQGELVTVSFTCADSLSGVGSCTGTQAAGGPLDTTTIGSHVVTVTAKDRVGNEIQLSKEYQVVSNEFVVTKWVDVDGTPTVGRQVSVWQPVFDPVPTAVAYQWTRNGVAIPGATGMDYVPTPNDAGTTLRVAATASKPAWQDRTIVSTGYQVLPGQITVSSLPVLTGAASVGGSLVVELGTVTPHTATLTHQWFRDGVLIPGAGDSVYYLQPEDIGKRISGRISATGPGYAEAVWVTAPSDVVRGRPLEVIGVPTVSGEMRAGSLLTAQAPTVRTPLPARSWDPATVAYQWLRGGTPIAGATQAAYRLLPEDVGSQVSVRITATRPAQEGYEPVVLVSIPGAAVTQATPTVAAKAKAKGDQKVKLTVTVAVPGLDPSAPVTVMRGGKVVARGTVTGSGRLVLTLKRQPKGKVTWTVVYAGSRGVAARSVRVSAKVR